jgi:hypothetical protein
VMEGPNQRDPQSIEGDVKEVLLLRGAVQDSDSTVRQRAAGTLEYVAGRDLGARDIIQHRLLGECCRGCPMFGPLQR